MTPMTRALALTAGILFLLAPFPAAAQQPVFRAGIEVIEVDVSVLDERGRPIEDLLAPEFTVTIGGQARNVLSAEFIRLRPLDRPARFREEPPEVFYSSNAARGPGRLVLIAVDRESISFGGGRHVMRAAGDFLARLLPDDKVALLTVPIGPVVDFTQNHALVRRELERLVGLAGPLRGHIQMGVYEAWALDRRTDPRIEAAVMERLCGELPEGTAAHEICVAGIRVEAGMIARQLQMRTENSFRALMTILRALRDVEGPKSLVWISEGLVSDGSESDIAEIGRLAAEARTTLNVVMIDTPTIDVSERFFSPTATDDRDLQVRGLELLADMARGGLYRVTTSAEAVFDRLESAMSGHYLLAVEMEPGDRDGRSHRIEVSVGRRGALVRARREFRVTPDGAASAETPQDRLLGALRAPFAATELPMRLATYAYQDPGSDLVRVVVAAEIEALEAEPAELLLGYALVDADGNTVAGEMQQATLAPREGARGPVLEHVGELALAPGTYQLKMAAVDAAGRRGSVEHPITAWLMTGLPFAVGDLLLADLPHDAGPNLRAPVEARVTSGRLAAYAELYTDDLGYLDGADVRVEVAANDTGPALASSPGNVATDDYRHHTVSATLAVDTLPPGEYVARLMVTRDDEQIGFLARPFQVVGGRAADAAVPSALPAPAVAAMLAGAPVFYRDDLVEGELLDFMMDVLDRGRPDLKATTARVRQGQLDGVAREAFETGDQLAALFLRGLELFADGELDAAATQFSAALQLEPEFGPAIFYMGACYAAAGREDQAVAHWQRSVSGRDRAPATYSALADMLFRLGRPGEAVEPLREALESWPEDPGLRRRFALALGGSQQHAEALEAARPYLADHPADHEVLLVGLHAIYASQVAGEPVLAEAEARAQMGEYARAYAVAGGPHQALVETWRAHIGR